MPTLGAILPNFREKQAMTVLYFIAAILVLMAVYTIYDNLEP